MARLDPLCVYCRQQRADPVSRPFCSERCRLADLGRWLSEGYSVPGEPDEDAASELPDNASERDRNHDDS